MDYPYIMAESITGAAILVTIDGYTVTFHDSEETFPGPVIAEYAAASLIDPMPTGTFALDLGCKATWLSAETAGVVFNWVKDETR